MSAVRFILGLKPITIEQYMEEISSVEGLYFQTEEYTPVFAVVKLKKAIKRRRNQRKKVYYTVEFVEDSFAVDVVKPTGLRFPLSKKVKLSEQYSFCIDERIYYRRLISKPALGPSPPFSLAKTSFIANAA